MKTKSLSIIVTLLLCITQISCAQQRKYATDKFDVEPFSAIKSNSVANITLKQASTTKVEASGSEDLLNALKISVSNGVLIIEMNDKVFKKLKRKSDKLQIDITTPDIRKIESEGVGNITLAGRIKTNELNIDTEGVGNLTIEDIQAEKIEIESAGVGNSILSGSANIVIITSEGVGNVKAENLKAKQLRVRSEGVGNVHCYASEDADIASEGIGSVTYYGNPKTKKINKNGIGKVKAGK